MSYKIGFCADCDDEITTREASGRIVGVLPHYRNVYVVFETADHKQSRMATPVCKDCVKAGLDPQKIYDRCLAAGEEAAKYYKDMNMTPVGIEPIDLFKR